LGGVRGESDRGRCRDEPESASPQNARGSKGCAKHELPRPQFLPCSTVREAKLCPTRAEFSGLETDLGVLPRPTGRACLKFLHHKPQISQW
jgi:hypothetical protein